MRTVYTVVHFYLLKSEDDGSIASFDSEAGITVPREGETITFNWDVIHQRREHTMEALELHEQVQGYTYKVMDVMHTIKIKDIAETEHRIDVYLEELS